MPWCITPISQLLQAHLGNMHIEACPGQQRRQYERIEVPAGHFGISVNAGFALHGLAPRAEVIQKRPCLLRGCRELDLADARAVSASAA